MKITIIAVVAVIAVYIILWNLATPVRTMLNSLIRGAVGCAIIYAINAFFAPLGFFIGINPVTYAICGILDVFGLIALIGIQLII